jgi:hypothetical protein
MLTIIGSEPVAGPQPFVLKKALQPQISQISQKARVPCDSMHSCRTGEIGAEGIGTRNHLRNWCNLWSSAFSRINEEQMAGTA